MATKRNRPKRRATSLQAPRSTSLTHARIDQPEFIEWGGLHIVAPEATVQRLLPGAGKGARPVKMDLRGFVPSKASTVVSAWTEATLDRVAQQYEWLAPALRGLRRPRSFDTVAHLLADAVFESIAYQERGGAAWQLAEETLARGQGDCEDRAVLLASSLVAAGISPYNVRVALGRIHVARGTSRPTARAHAWVMYRAEDGRWTMLEPVPNRTSAQHADLRFTTNGHWSRIRPSDNSSATTSSTQRSTARSTAASSNTRPPKRTFRSRYAAACRGPSPRSSARSSTTPTFASGATIRATTSTAASSNSRGRWWRPD
jgi:hypothetical protein